MIKILKLIKQYNKEASYIKENIGMINYIKCYLKIAKYEKREITKEELKEYLGRYGMDYNN